MCVCHMATIVCAGAGLCQLGDLLKFLHCFPPRAFFFFFFLNSYFEHSSQPGLATRAFSLTPLPTHFHSVHRLPALGCGLGDILKGLW